MLERVFIAGAGGQGIILIGRVLAAASVDGTPHVTFFPDYGAEVRGGSSKCQVTLSSEEIASPVSNEFESLIVMNQTSADRFHALFDNARLVLLNRSLCRVPEPPHPNTVAIPATELAAGLGSERSANFIMLGAYLARRPVVPPEKVAAQIAAALGDRAGTVATLNLRAFRLGLGV
jgi:2-oxoglutarate ferredoxin oxidoreductase subunit gamma